MSKLIQFKVYYEYHENHPEILKMIRRAKLATKKRREALQARREKK